jgi:hypothetical protein
MFALGCVQSMKCHTDACPTGVATQDETRQRGLVVEDKGERVARFQRQTLASLREMVIAMGLENPWQIAPCHISERLNSAKSDRIDNIYGFLKENQLLDDPASTQYAEDWEKAQAHTFGEATCRPR